MSTVQSNTLEIQALKESLALLLNNSTQPKDGVSTTTTTDDTLFPIQNVGEDVKFIRKADFLVAVLGSVRRISDTPANNENDGVNQLVIGSKTGINGGNPFIGIVDFYPPSQDSHITEIIFF